MNKKSFTYLCAVEAFILSPDKTEVLLLKRGMHKSVLPGYYAGVGGKMDSKNIESPIETALREIKEESGYTMTDLVNLEFRGVYTVEDKFGRWNVFEFLGIAKNKLFEKKEEISEGCLEWVPIKELSRYRLIQDLQNGYLEQILKPENFLWVTVTYDKHDNIASIRKKQETIF